MHLTVRSAFLVQQFDAEGKPTAKTMAFEKGDKITDADLIAEVLKGENASHVVRTAGEHDANAE